MSIKFQKIIRFVPFINYFATFFSLIIAYRSSNKSRIADIFRIVIAMVMSMLLVNVPQMILSHFFKDAVFNSVLSFISAYITLFVISSIAIFQQEKYAENDKK